MADPLAIWAVEISAGQGIEILNAQLDTVNAKLNVIDNATKNTGNTIKNSMLTGAERVAILGAGYGYLAGKVMGFVNAGLAGTAEAERLNFVMTHLNRQIASIFTPAIHATIDKLAQLTDWFRRLSGAQQEQIRDITGMGLAFLGVVTIVPKLIAGIVALGGALKALVVLNPILFIVASIAALLVITEEGRTAIGKLGAALLPLASIATSILQVLEPIAVVLAKIVNVIATILTPIVQVLAAVGGWFVVTVLLTNIIYVLGTTAGIVFLKMIAYLVSATTWTGALTVAMGLLNTAIWAIKFAFDALKAHPIFAILALIVGIGSFIAGLFSSKKEKPKEELTVKASAIESFEQTWARIQQDIAKTDVAQETRLRQLAVQEQIRDALLRRGINVAAADIVVS